MLDALNKNGTNESEILAVATPGQRIVYAVFVVDDEIANGGYYQVFWNLNGGLVQTAIRHADQVGAHRWASLVRQAAAKLFPKGLPSDVNVQRRLIGCPGYCAHSKVDSLTKQWIDGELRPPLRRYVQAHPAEFYAASQ